MNQAFIFDVDGTLTPSRQPITEEMREFFTQFAQNHDVYLVSGSDYAKTVEQLGQDLVEDIAKRSYNCSGNSIWERSMEMYRSPWRLPGECATWMERILETSDYPEKTGNHIEIRPGAVNFSIVGRNADVEQRARYVEHDQATGERERLAEEFNLMFSHLGVTALIGGETGLDVTQAGCDKSQILQDFEDRPVVFFGDRCEPGGNDHSLAKAVLERGYDEDRVHNVSGWQETLELLTKYR